VYLNHYNYVVQINAILDLIEHVIILHDALISNLIEHTTVNDLLIWHFHCN
jgi:hypothetical protein